MTKKQSPTIHFILQDNKPEMVLTYRIESDSALFWKSDCRNTIESALKQDKIMNLLDIIHIEIARKYSETHLHEAHSV
jgi:hypothetical protein